MEIFTDWFIYVILAEYVGLFIGVFVWVYRTKLRTIFEARFYRRLSGHDHSDCVYTLVGTKEFKKSDKIVTFKKMTFPVNLQRIAFTDRRKTVICYDIDRNDVIHFGGVRFIGNTSDVNAVMESGFVEKVVEEATGLSKVMILMLVMALGIGACLFVVGLFVSPYVLPGV